MACTWLRLGDTRAPGDGGCADGELALETAHLVALGMPVPRCVLKLSLCRAAFSPSEPS